MTNTTQTTINVILPQRELDKVLQQRTRLAYSREDHPIYPISQSVKKEIIQSQTPFYYIFRKDDCIDFVTVSDPNDVESVRLFRCQLDGFNGIDLQTATPRRTGKEALEYVLLRYQSQTK